MQDIKEAFEDEIADLLLQEREQYDTEKAQFEKEKGEFRVEQEVGEKWSYHVIVISLAMHQI